MTDKNWKRMERRVAKKLGGKRNPLSGSMSRHTAGDVIHDRFYVECKYRKNFSIYKWFDDVKKKASRERKIPALVLKEKNRHGELVVLQLDDFSGLVSENKSVLEGREKEEGN